MRLRIRCKKWFFICKTLLGVYMSIFLKLIEDGLQKKSSEKSTTDLGERSRYIGASDLPRCVRQSVLKKLEESEYDLKSLIRMKRGDIAEDILVSGLSNSGVTIISKQTCGKQFSLEEEIDGVPYKAHLDVVIQYEVNDMMYYGVVECKSISTSIPRKPDSDHIEQLNFGMGLLKRKNPTAQVFGSLFLINIQSGECGFFDHSYSEAIFEKSLLKGVRLWNYLTSYKSGEIESTDILAWVNLGCSTCNDMDDCPRYAGEDCPELIPMIEEAMKYSAERSAAEKNYDSLKSSLVDIMNNKGITALKSGSFTVSNSVRSRKGYDAILLAEFVESHGGVLESFEDNTTFSVVTIRKASEKKSKKGKKNTESEI